MRKNYFVRPFILAVAVIVVAVTLPAPVMAQGYAISAVSEYNAIIAQSPVSFSVSGDFAIERQLKDRMLVKLVEESEEQVGIFNFDALKRRIDLVVSF